MVTYILTFQNVRFHFLFGQDTKAQLTVGLIKKEYITKYHKNIVKYVIQHRNKSLHLPIPLPKIIIMFLATTMHP